MDLNSEISASEAEGVFYVARRKLENLRALIRVMDRYLLEELGTPGKPTEATDDMHSLVEIATRQANETLDDFGKVEDFLCMARHRENQQKRRGSNENH